jgi:hypothetical protein
LAPTRRAGLAIVCLTEKGPQDVAELLGISGPAAGRLLTDAWAELAALLDQGIDEAGTTLRGWLWAEPPAELWQRIFTRFHQALQSAGPDADPDPAAPAAARTRSRWRVGKLALAAGLGAAAVAAVASYAVPTLGGNGGPTKAGARAGQAADVAGQATGAAGTASQRAPLTPEELDRRRLAELHDLRVQAQRDAARSATASEKPSRQSAADDAARARVRRARARQLRRERARARQLASEPGPTARKRRPKSPPAPAAPTPAPAPAPAPAPTGDALTKDEADKSCLYNPDTGTYVCPQG